MKAIALARWGRAKLRRDKITARRTYGSEAAAPGGGEAAAVSSEQPRPAKQPRLSASGGEAAAPGGQRGASGGQRAAPVGQRRPTSSCREKEIERDERDRDDRAVKRLEHILSERMDQIKEEIDDDDPETFDVADYDEAHLKERGEQQLSSLKFAREQLIASRAYAGYERRVEVEDAIEEMEAFLSSSS